MKKVTIYTDGACSGNPGVGGWCAILMYKQREKVVSGYNKYTTNNRMELFSVIEGLAQLKEPCEVDLYSDSAYVVNAINNGWLESWQRSSWRKSDGEVIRSVILSSGRWGIACFFALTYLSVVILPVPAAVLIVAGTYVYGPWISFAVSASATFVGSLTCFYLGRKLGKKLLFWLFDREKVEKYAAILGEKGKIPFFATMFLPFFPDDLICISAGVTDMKFGFFAISTLFARSAYVFAVSVLGGGEIIPFRGWGIAVWVGIFAVCVLAFVLISKRISSKKKA